MTKYFLPMMTFSHVKRLLQCDQIISPLRKFNAHMWMDKPSWKPERLFEIQTVEVLKMRDLNSTPASASTTPPFRFFGKTSALSHDPPPGEAGPTAEWSWQAEERQTCIPAIVGGDVLARVKPRDPISLPVAVGLLAQLQGSAAAPQTLTVWHVWHGGLRLMHSAQLKPLLSGECLPFPWFLIRNTSSCTGSHVQLFL